MWGRGTGSGIEGGLSRAENGRRNPSEAKDNPASATPSPDGGKTLLMPQLMTRWRASSRWHRRTSPTASARPIVIRNRPRQHLEREGYQLLVPGPYAVQWDKIPDLIKLSLLNVDGVQPLTGGRCAAAGGLTSCQLSSDEVDYYRKRDARFQLLMIVTNCIRVGSRDDPPRLLPYSMTLMPSSKRGRVTEFAIDFVAQFSGAQLMGGDTAYVGFDPFAGDWQMWGNASVVVGPIPRPGFIDELGLVYDHYFLETTHDPKDIGYFFPDIPDAVKKRYAKNLSKLLFRPFECVRTRRIWGLETAIELFVFQEIANRNLPIPQPQVMIMQDGTNFPCLYDAWSDFGEESSLDLVTEADFLFPEHRVALFCDGAQHSRRRNQDRDKKIDKRLNELGYRSIRLNSKRILNDVSDAVNELAGALTSEICHRAYQY